MNIKNVKISLKRILRNNNYNRIKAFSKYFLWQIRKIFNLFPFQQRISNSKNVAPNKKCGVSALIYFQGLYDHHNMNFLKELIGLHPNKIFFDIGANI